MRRCALAAVPFFLLACNPESTAPVGSAADPLSVPAANAASVDQYVIHGSGATDFYVDCTGESMHLGGTFDIEVKDVTLPDGELQEQWINRLEPDWVFVGNTSGDIWDLQYNGYNLVVLVRFDESGLTFHAEHEHLRFKNRATGTVLVLDSKFHFSRNAAGEVKVDRVEGDCRLIQ
ncbi:MAG TPA: hypothetical protein VNH46_10920 [Gemmatimonadales bacterium]|nr:hypothetical protein [Gemmatimonadales bacterium]